jgi:hypothetical protein
VFSLGLGESFGFVSTEELAQGQDGWSVFDRHSIGRDNLLDVVTLGLGCPPARSNSDNVALANGGVGVVYEDVLGVGEGLGGYDEMLASRTVDSAHD